MKPPSARTESCQKKRVLPVDDHAVVRDGIALWITQTPDMQVCGTAEQTSAAIRSIKQLRPDIVITDIGMPGRDGLELTRDIKARWPALIFSVHDETLYAVQALRAGAREYSNQNSGPEALVDGRRGERAECQGALTVRK